MIGPNRVVCFAHLATPDQLEGRHQGDLGPESHGRGDGLQDHLALVAEAATQDVDLLRDGHHPGHDLRRLHLGLGERCQLAEGLDEAQCERHRQGFGEIGVA